MTPAFVIGIDPGVRGGFCVMLPDFSVLMAANFPVIERVVDNHREGQKATRKDTSLDLPAIAKTLGKCVRDEYSTVAYMELVHSQPGQGVATMFKFGLCRGQIEGVFAGLKIPFITTSPREWQKEIHSQADLFIKMNAKERSRRAYHKQIDPFADRVHDGVIDATLIALYGRRRLASGMDSWRFK